MDRAVLDELDALRARASAKLDWQAARHRKYQLYYDGEAAIPAMLDTEERRTFVEFLRMSGANWSELVVNAVAERLDVVGFDFGESSDRAWLMWQANGMDADAELVQTDALIGGTCPVLVQPDDANPSGVSISPESPKQACVLYHPGDRRVREAGYKRWSDEHDPLMAGQDVTEVLITPEWIVTWYPGDQAQGSPSELAANPAGVVGMVEVIPQPRLMGAPRSELKPVLPMADRINTTIFDRLVGSDFGAFRQVWATGVKMAREVVGEDESTGEAITRPVAPYNVGANRLLINENPDGRFGAIPGDPMAGYLAAVEQDVKQLAAITQTPPHYLLGSMINLSADAIKASEAGLVKKVSRRARHIGEAWEDVVRIALGLVGDAGATDVAGQVNWADFETRSLGQLVDALVKMRTLGVPLEVLWARYGASPQDIERWRELAREEAANGTAPATPAPGQPAPGPAPGPAPEPASSGAA